MTFFLRLLALQITLAWNQNVEPVAGYKVHYGAVTRVYTQHVDVGNTLNCPLNLAPGKYYFTVTAYNSFGVESQYSNEIVYTVASPTPSPGPTASPTISPSPSPSATVSPSPTPSPTVSPSPSPTPTATPTPSPIPIITISGHVGFCGLPAPASGVTVTLSGGVNASTTTNQNGDYSFTIQVGATYTVTASKPSLPPGSPAISLIDVIAVNNYYLGQGTLKCLEAAEVNGVPPVNIMDVVGIHRFTVGVPSGIVGRYTFTPLSPTLDFKAVLAGDVE